MNTGNYSLNVTAENPHSLSDEDFEKLNEVTQDMWADGIGEFVQCNQCGEIQGKQEIFGCLSKDVYSHTVAGIMGILDIEEIVCPCCNGDTRFIYGKGNIDAIRERLTQSEAFIVICRDRIGKIIGYMDMYVDTLEVIYRRELESHYSLIGIAEIRRRLEKILGVPVSQMISFSAMGMLREYTSMYLVYKIWSTLSASKIPAMYETMPGITELDRNNNLCLMYRMMGSHTLGFPDDEAYRSKITNTGKYYASDIVTFSEPVQNFRTKFSVGLKPFLRSYSQTRKIGGARKDLLYV